MMQRIGALAFLLLWSASCGQSATKTREYELEGVVRAVDVDKKQVTIAHGDVKGLMPGMTMPFDVKDAALLKDRAPGDQVKATLVVQDNGAYLSTMEKTGTAPPATTPASPAASSGFELTKVGQPIEDVSLVDQDGRKQQLSAHRGSVLAITFTYTRCPLPTFCPLMDQHFVKIQRAIKGDPKLAGKVRLLSITLDPAFDTPAVLKQHATALGADPKVWSFATGHRDDLDRLGTRLGLLVQREGKEAEDITHSLRTVIVNRAGALEKVYQGNEWTPDQVVAELGRVVAGD